MRRICLYLQPTLIRFDFFFLINMCLRSQHTMFSLTESKTRVCIFPSWSKIPESTQGAFIEFHYLKITFNLEITPHWHIKVRGKQKNNVNTHLEKNIYFAVVSNKIHWLHFKIMIITCTFCFPYRSGGTVGVGAHCSSFFKCTIRNASRENVSWRVNIALPLIASLNDSLPSHLSLCLSAGGIFHKSHL